MEHKKWLLLSYKVPTEPSSKRVSIWCKIKGLGAVYIQNGVCILPNTDEHLRHFKIIQNEIMSVGGDATLLDTVGFDNKDEKKLVSHFSEERNMEYQDFFWVNVETTWRKSITKRKPSILPMPNFKRMMRT